MPLTGTAPASAAPAEREAGPLRVMSFNLRFASTAEPHSWAARRPVTRALLRHERPHVLGTQEGLYQQVRDIEADLGASYDWIGTGRAGGSRDEFMAVYYDTRRLAPLEYDHFWLSDTPDVIGSNTWGGGSIRMVTWVRFRDLRDGA
ncbi:endonuclease, partial [Streptomyces sp. TRM76130]|nr:endonuclease [Streptomyces sp. TRM76130]